MQSPPPGRRKNPWNSFQSQHRQLGWSQERIRCAWEQKKTLDAENIDTSFLRTPKPDQKQQQQKQQQRQWKFEEQLRDLQQVDQRAKQPGHTRSQQHAGQHTQQGAVLPLEQQFYKSMQVVDTLENTAEGASHSSPRLSQQQQQQRPEGASHPAPRPSQQYQQRQPEGASHPAPRLSQQQQPEGASHPAPRLSQQYQQQQPEGASHPAPQFSQQQQQQQQLLLPEEASYLSPQLSQQQEGASHLAPRLTKQQQQTLTDAPDSQAVSEGLHLRQQSGSAQQTAEQERWQQDAEHQAAVYLKHCAQQHHHQQQQEQQLRQREQGSTGNRSSSNSNNWGSATSWVCKLAARLLNSTPSLHLSPRCGATPKPSSSSPTSPSTSTRAAPSKPLHLPPPRSAAEQARSPDALQTPPPAAPAASPAAPHTVLQCETHRVCLPASCSSSLQVHADCSPTPPPYSQANTVQPQAGSPADAMQPKIEVLGEGPRGKLQSMQRVVAGSDTRGGAQLQALLQQHLEPARTGSAAAVTLPTSAACDALQPRACSSPGATQDSTSSQDESFQTPPSSPPASQCSQCLDVSAAQLHRVPPPAAAMLLHPVPLSNQVQQQGHSAQQHQQPPSSKLQPAPTVARSPTDHMHTVRTASEGGKATSSSTPLQQHHNHHRNHRQRQQQQCCDPLHAEQPGQNRAGSTVFSQALHGLAVHCLQNAHRPEAQATIHHLRQRLSQQDNQKAGQLLALVNLVKQQGAQNSQQHQHQPYCVVGQQQEMQGEHSQQHQHQQQLNAKGQQEEAQEGARSQHQNQHYPHCAKGQKGQLQKTPQRVQDQQHQREPACTLHKKPPACTLHKRPPAHCTKGQQQSEQPGSHHTPPACAEALRALALHCLQHAHQPRAQRTILQLLQRLPEPQQQEAVRRLVRANKARQRAARAQQRAQQRPAQEHTHSAGAVWVVKTEERWAEARAAAVAAAAGLTPAGDAVDAAATQHASTSSVSAHILASKNAVPEGRASPSVMQGDLPESKTTAAAAVTAAARSEDATPQAAPEKMPGPQAEHAGPTRVPKKLGFKAKKFRPEDWWRLSSGPDDEVANLPDFATYANEGSLRVQAREHVPDDHDRFFEGFSDWMKVSPGAMVSRVRREIPRDAGLYEWGCSAPGSTKILAFYLGQSGDIGKLKLNKETLRSRFYKYTNSAVPWLGPLTESCSIKALIFRELQRKGFTLHYRWCVCPHPEEKETAILTELDYAANSRKNKAQRQIIICPEQGLRLVDFPIVLQHKKMRQ